LYEENLPSCVDINIWTRSIKGQEKMGLDVPAIKKIDLIKREQNKKWAINIFCL
jgi:hypothetical protein